MRDLLLLFLPVDSHAPLRWGHWDGEAIIETGETAMSSLSDLTLMDLAVIAIAPGQDIHCFTHDIPKMNRRDRRKAILFSLEDNLSSPLEQLHVALGDDDKQTVSIVERRYMDEALAWAERSGLNVRRLITDFDALSQSDHTAIDLSDRIVFPGATGYTLDPQWHDGAAVTLDINSLFTLAAQNLPQTTNLLQGEYAPKSQFGGQTKSWLQLGGLAASIGVAFLFYEGLQANAVKAQAKNIRNETATLYTRVTGQPAPSNPARAVAQAKQSGRLAPTEFLALSDIAFRALGGFDDVRIERVTFQDSRSELQLRLIYPSYERAEEVNRAMQAAGGAFTPGGVREQSGQFIGEAVLKIKGTS